MNAIPLSLYIHFPWCVKKCPYCDFNWHSLDGELPAASYVDQLIVDLENEVKHQTRPALTSIFMGGGTPSLFPPDEIHRLLDAVRTHFDISTCEITMEANPGTFDQANFHGYRNAGINRLSIGAQSFSDRSLRTLGRVHRADEIETAFKGARQAGFQRINLDLMYALPGQSADDAVLDLAQAISLSPEPISWYPLTIEPNTYFHRFPPEAPSEHLVEEIMQRGLTTLTSAGYRNYEVSAFAKAGEASKHNLNYWEFGDYIGIGAGAHCQRSNLPTIERTSKTRLPKDYLNNHAPIISTVPHEEIALEYLMNALRLTDGFKLDNFEARTGLCRTSLDDFIASASDKGLLFVDNDTVATTTLGRLYLNDLLLLAN